MTLGSFAETIFKRTYAFDQNETWDGCAARVSKLVANGDDKLEKEFFEVISERKFIPGGRYLYSAGRDIAQTTNCFLLKAEDSREGWGQLLNKHVVALSTGGGVGTEYSQLREKGALIKRFGGKSSGPIALMCMVNEVARHVMAGGIRRSALWAGLAWWHPDTEEFIKTKNWATGVRAMKEQDFNFPAPLDMTNISVRLDKGFFNQVKKDESVRDLYYRICKSMCKTGEPGFSIELAKLKKEI
jgi:ribonucleoside-diphosphate reductase alpha chain